MIIWFLLGGGALLLGTGTLVGLFPWLHPAHRARFLAVAFLTGLCVVEAGLLLWAAPAMLDLFGLTDLAVVCRRMLVGLVPEGGIGGSVATVAAIWLGLRVGQGVLRTRRLRRGLRVESIVAAAQHRVDHDLVMLPSARLLAYTVGGRRPQIVLTRGVVEGLSSASVQAIVAHELAHARSGHHRFLSLAGGVETAFGWLAPVAAAVRDLRVSLERWADEDASLLVPRESVRKALLEAALFDTIPAGIAGFGDADLVARRASALASGPPTRRSLRIAMAYLAVGAGLVTTWGAVGWAARMSILAVANPGRCLL